MNNFNGLFRKNTVLSFDALIQYLREKVEGVDNAATKLLLEHILQEVDKRPELKGQLRDLSFLQEHREIVQQLMSSIISPIDFDKELLAIIKPFDLSGLVFSTQKWNELIDLKNFNFNFKELDFETFEQNTNTYIHSLILSEIYGQQRIYIKNLLITVPSKINGLNRYYKIYFDRDFAQVIPKKTPPKLSEEVLELLSDNPHDSALWHKYIDANDFEICGFVVLRLIDVTQNEVLSSLKYDLLEKDAIIAREKFGNLEQKLRELYDLPDLRMGIVSFTFDKEGNKSGPKIWNSIVTEEDTKEYLSYTGLSEEEAFEGCIYHTMTLTGETQTISNLEKLKDPSAIDQLLLQKGIKSILVSPLHYNGEFLGAIEIASSNPHDFNNSSMILLQDILPIFSLAAKRSLEELESKLQAIIKEEYTAVHPAVEWKFVQAALISLNKTNTNGDAPQTEEIVFNDVFPVYGQSDVRGSSTERNKAIKEDLTSQLLLGKEVLNKVFESYPMGIIGEINSRIDGFMEEIKEGIGSGDEMTILYFLKNELEPLLEHFKTSNVLSTESYNHYFGALDAELGILYKKRKSFEDSLTKINDKIANYLEEQQDIIQKTYPHYFEKYKTDGVEYNIYMGQSITPQKPFNKIYLQDLRLWQLKTTAEIAQMTESLKTELPLPLEATHLILVNSAPISIRFREDEKQFDVDGAYNIRYEIIKKRIDKANIKDVDERITQPGKIAIVYTQDKEAEEYKRYICYLQKQGLLEDVLEDHALEELQGVNGLRALRIQVKIPDLKRDNIPKNIVEKILHAEDS